MFQQGPFNDQAEAIRRMVDLLAVEAASSGLALSDEEREMLSQECQLPEHLQNRAKELILQIFEREQALGETDVFEHPDSFGNSLEWAGDPLYPNIARLSEEVILEGRATGTFPLADRLHGWGLIKDRVLLVGCGLVVVLLVLVVGAMFFSR